MNNMRPRKTGLFGSKGFQGTPPIADPNMGQTQRMGAQGQPKGGFLGDNTSAKLMALGGLLSGDGGHGVAQFYQQRAMDGQAAAKQAAEMRKRSLDRDDFKFEHDYKNANRAPVNNDTVADYEFIKGNLGEEAATEFLKNKANPPQYRQGADGRFYRIDAAKPPTRPVGQLRPVGGGQSAAPKRFSQPQMTVTTKELDALVRQYGPDVVQSRINSGQVAVRN